MKVKKSEMLDYVIILSIFLQLVILGFFGLNAFMNRVISILIIIRMVLHIKPIPKFGVIITAVVAALFFMSSRIGVRSPSALISNFLLILYPLIYVFYGFYICRFNSKLVKRILNNSFDVINAVMIINIMVMLIQIKFPYSIQAKITANEIKYYEDTISGLFAYGSTHVVGLFCIFVTLYNLSYRKKRSKGRQRKILWYTIFLLLINSYISLNNDNKAFFFLLPIFLVLYLTLDNRRMSYKRFTTVMGLILILSLLLTAAYISIPGVSRFVDNSVVGTLADFLSNYQAGNKAVGSNERIAIIGYALGLPSTWRFGQGIGTGQLGESGLHGFRHFGQSDMGSFLLLLGIWFFVSIILSYIYFCTSIIRGELNIKLPKLFVVAFLLMLIILAIYTQCFSRTNIATCILLITMALYIKVQNVFEPDTRLKP